MRVIWASYPATASEVIGALSAQDSSWHPKTVRSLLARLVKKKALSYTVRGNAYFYEPLVAEADCIAAASDSFLERVFAGYAQPLLAHFVERRRLSAEELAELRRLLDEPGPTKLQKNKRSD